MSRKERNETIVMVLGLVTCLSFLAYNGVLLEFGKGIGLFIILMAVFWGGPFVVIFLIDFIITSFRNEIRRRISKRSWSGE